MGHRRASVEFKDVEAIKETERALLILFEDGREVWLPKSAIHDDSEVFEAEHEGTLHVFEWFVEKNGWPNEQ